MAFYSTAVDIIRQRMARLVDDLILATVSSGSTSTAILATSDPPKYRESNDDYFNDHYYEAYCYEGSGIGQSALATDWVNATHTLTLSPTQSAAYDSTCKLELHRLFSSGEYLNAINLACGLYSRKYLIDYKDETSITLVEGETNDGQTIYTYEYSLPTDMLYIHRVTKEGCVSGKKLTGTVSGAFTLGEKVTGGTSGATGILSYGPSGSTYILIREVSGSFEVGETATGSTSSETCSSITAIDDEEVGNGKFEIEDIVDPRDYTIIKSYPPKIKFHEDYFSVTGDLRIRLEGQATQDSVSNDTDIIYLPPDEFVEVAVSYLPLPKIDSDKLVNIFNNCLATRRLVMTRGSVPPRAGSKKVKE